MLNNITFIGYIVAMLMIGIYAARYNKSIQGYVLGGRQINPLIIAASVCASDMSSWVICGLPAQSGVSTTGLMSGLCIVLGLLIGSWLNWKLVAGRIRSFSANAADALTVPDYLVARFDDKKKIISLISSVIILVFFTVYAASGMVGSARLFEEVLFGNANALLDASQYDKSDIYTISLLVGAAVSITYVVIGGFMGVSIADLFQAILMIAALVLLPIVMLFNVGGWDTALAIIEEKDAALNGGVAPNPFSAITWSEIIGSLSWGLGYFGAIQVVSRFMASGSVRGLGTSRRIATTWMIFSLVGSLLIGYFGIAFLATNPDVILDNPEKIFMVAVHVLIPDGIGGLMEASLLAAIMSSLSAQLLICSTSMTVDLYKNFLYKPKDDRIASPGHLVVVGRVSLLIISILAIIVAADPNAGIFNLVSIAWGGFGAAFGPAILASLYWKCTTRTAILASIVTGAVVVGVWSYFNIWNLYCLVPAFIASSAVLYIVSKVTYVEGNECEKIFLRLEKKFWQEVKDRS